MSAFGKRTPLTHGHFAEFEKCFGKKSDGTSKRTDQGNEGRFRKFTREYITERDDNLDISWLKDRDASSGVDLPEPDVIATQIRERLSEALEEIDALSALLDPTPNEAFWALAWTAETEGLTPPWTTRVLFHHFTPTGQPYASPGQRPGLWRDQNYKAPTGRS